MTQMMISMDRMDLEEEDSGRMDSASASTSLSPSGSVKYYLIVVITQVAEVMPISSTKQLVQVKSALALVLLGLEV